MIDIRRLKELVKLMVENDLSELDLRDQEETVTIKRGPEGPVMIQPPPHQAAPAAAPAPAHAQDPAGDAGGGADETPADDGLVPIESPMVGTFYSAPNPEAEPFVAPGSSISADTVVCLVEAMKVFNEIKAETRGAIEKVLVTSGQAVEYGQPLFLLRPA